MLYEINNNNFSVSVSEGSSHLLAKHDHRALLLVRLGLNVMMFNTTFNNILAISWRSVLLVKETRVPGENHRPVTSH